MEASPKVGLEALLTPDNCVLVLIDHQPFQLANVNSHEPTMVMNNVTALAKTARAFNVPTILTTVNEERGGLIFKTVQDVFPNQTTINRTFINAWEDKRVVDPVKDTGRKKLVIAALWSEMCLAMPGIHAMGDGYHVYVVTDASGASLQKHTIWRSGASWLREPNRLHGLAWPENSGVIGRRAQRGSARSFSYFATTQAPPALYSHGRCSCYGSRKSHVRTASEAAPESDSC
jgi:nicotinamidase-related amidase